jgi:hypothetical protein
VEYTPGVFQNTRSAPQKHPKANTAVSVPLGHGATKGASSTKCFSGMGMNWSVLPGSAFAGSTMSAFCLPKFIEQMLDKVYACCVTHRLFWSWKPYERH